MPVPASRPLRALHGLLMLASLGLSMRAAAAAPGSAPAVETLRLVHAEAARAGWNAATPPARGWVPVTLPDIWTARWPEHNGVVWYRLDWIQRDARVPTGLLIDHIDMAAAVYVNGSLVFRAAHLREPLSRNWTRPHYVLLDAPLLHAGRNTLLVRVSGLAAYHPGMGAVRVGAPAALRARYALQVWLRGDMHIFDLTVDIVMATLFGMLWLLRRKDTLYGWFALSSAFGAAYGWNFVASSPWPFSSTDAWMALHAALHMATAACFTLFLLRYAELRWPRTERALLLVAALTLLAGLLLPGWMGPRHLLVELPAMLVMYAAILGFIVFAARSRRVELKIPALFLILPIVAAVHDNLVQTNLIAGENYLSDLTSPVTLVGISFVLAYRFVVAMRRVEGFNAELEHRVAVANGQLRATLAREQALGVANARMSERIDLVRDLHDGFGGSLLSAIAGLQAQPPSAPRAQAVDVLKDLRDDLRLVIDATTHADDQDLADLIAILRHRSNARMELAGIASRWRCAGIEGIRLEPARGLDLLRLLQEALTNVLKHSGATRLDVLLRREEGCVRVEVADDGRGFDVDAAQGAGAGLSSMGARARRLGCALTIDSTPGKGTRIGCSIVLASEPSIPMPSACAGAATMPAQPGSPATGKP